MKSRKKAIILLLTMALIKSRMSTVIEVWELSLSTLLFRWYDYTLTFAPEETLVNMVSAPLYPSANFNYVPPVYSYTYLLSPAAGWADFNNLTIRIYTDMYLLRGETRKSVTNPDGLLLKKARIIGFFGILPNLYKRKNRANTSHSRNSILFIV